MADSKTAAVDIDEIHASLKAAYNDRVLLPLEHRIRQLQALAYAVLEHKEELQLALKHDLGQHPMEAEYTQINPVIWAATDYVDNVRKWAASYSIPAKHPAFLLYNTRIDAVPRGPALVIGPYNYPLKLAFEPLCAALAAGCPALLLLSEASPRTGQVMKRIVEGALDPRVVRVEIGGKDEGVRATAKPWGRVVFTGSTKVGLEVAVACAKTLTPVTLELGGKNPSIVDSTADLYLAAKRTLVYKVLNCSQTCTTSDHTLIPRALQTPYVDHCLAILADWFPEGELSSDSYGILSHARIAHLSGLLDATRGRVVRRGAVDLDRGKMGISVVVDVPEDDVLMRDEVFGPIVVVVPKETVKDAVRFVNQGENPLGIWLFTDSRKTIEYVYKNTLSGGIIVNDCAQTALVDSIPFGGVGASGHGSYRGKWGFDLFTHERGSIAVPKWAEPLLASRYPPYDKFKRALFQAFLLPLPLPFAHPKASALARMKWWACFWWRKRAGWRALALALVLAFGVRAVRRGDVSVVVGGREVVGRA